MQIDIANNYEYPENYIRLDVRNPKVKEEGRNAFVEYEVECKVSTGRYSCNNVSYKTNLIAFAPGHFIIHRRFRDFVLLRRILENQSPDVELKDLPYGGMFVNKVDPDLTAERIPILKKFLQRYTFMIMQ